MVTQRQKILNYIIEQQSTTVEELSKVFKVTPANIRHHLSILSEGGSVRIIGLKPTPPRGRPAQIYAATQKTNQNNLDRLSEALLSLLLADVDAQKRIPKLRKVAKQMVEKYKPGPYNPTKRLYYAIRTLNRMNYQAHWEAHVSNPRIMFAHCPYQAIREDHPEICQLDCYILQELFGRSIVQIEKLALNTKNLPECAFKLN